MGYRAEGTLSRIFTFDGIHAHAGNDVIQTDTALPAVGYIRWATVCITCPAPESSCTVYNVASDTLLAGEYVTVFRVRTFKHTAGAGNIRFKVTYCLE